MLTPEALKRLTETVPFPMPAYRLEPFQSIEQLRRNSVASHTKVLNIPLSSSRLRCVCIFLKRFNNSIIESDDLPGYGLELCIFNEDSVSSLVDFVAFRD